MRRSRHLRPFHQRACILPWAAVLLLALRPLPAQVAPSRPGQKQPAAAAEAVAGRVLSTDGRPLPNAVVTLAQKEDNAPEALSAHTDPEGRYRFPPQPAGRYRLRAAAPGYLPSLLQQHGQFSTAVVLGAGLQTGTLEIRLTRAASIHGRVTDTFGDPVERANVTLYRKLNPAGTEPAADDDTGPRATRFRSTVVDGTGAYEFGDLPPATYFVEAAGQPWYAVHPPLDSPENPQMYRAAVDPALDVAFAPVFYPAGPTPDGAAPLEIKGGERLLANLQMRAEPAVSLTVQLPDAAPGQRFRQPQLSRTVFGVREPVPSPADFRPGLMRITGLTRGDYNVEEFQQGRGNVAHGTVSLGSGSATASLADLERAPQTSVTVHVSAAGGDALPADLQVHLAGTVGSSLPNSRGSTKLDDHGSAVVDGVASGTYRVVLSRNGRVLPVVTLTVDGRASADHRLQVPSDGKPLAVQVDISSATTSVTGTVRRGAEPMGGCMVVLVPAGDTTTADLFRRDQSDLDGGFTLQNVPPGNYLLLAIADDWQLAWTDVKALMPYLQGAIPVTVTAKSGSSFAVVEPVRPQKRGVPPGGR